MRRGKYEKVKNPVVNVAMCMALVLFWLVVISTYMTGGLYARYVTQGTGSDSARVIRFGELTLTETGDFTQDGNLMIIPGVDVSKKAVVKFTGSESATYVFAKVTPSASWSITDHKSFSLSGNFMGWSIAEGWTYLTSDSGYHVFYRELAPNTTLEADLIAGGTVSVSEQITRTEMKNLPDVRIGFQAFVIQSGGFSSPQAAWESLAAKEG